jgi:hypothetical protein
VEELAARAALVPATQVSGGLTTTIARSSVEEALRADEPPALIVDITRSSDSGEAAETRSVAISWERGELEELLGQASTGEVTLTFDRAALEEAMSSDVEAHGLKEKVLVLAIAATAAAGTAAGASAMPVTAGGGGAAPTTQVQSLSPDDRAVAVESAAATNLGPADGWATRAVEGPQTNLGPQDGWMTRAVEGPQTGSNLSPDDRAVPVSSPTTPATSVSPDDRAVPLGSPASHVTSLSPDDRAAPRAAPSTPAQSPDDRNVPFGGGLAPATSADDGGISINAPSPEAIALGGAFALAITGAAFAIAGSRRRVTPA